METLFPVIEDKTELEKTSVFAPRFDSDGLIAAIVCDHETHKLLMVGYMNDIALSRTLSTGKAHYWSRSRQKLWLKGETSGNVQKVREIRTDCDQDAIQLLVEVTGASATCHTGKESCFYRIVEGAGLDVKLVDDGSHRHFDPAEVYSKDD